MTLDARLFIVFVFGLLFAPDGFIRAEPASMADPLDAVIGKWKGEVGSPENHSVWAIEIKRNEKGVATGFIYSSLINFYGLDVGEVTYADGVYTLPPFAWTVNLVDGRLVAKDLGKLKTSIDLRRTETLPSEVPVPALPSGPAPLWKVKLAGGIYARAAVRDGVAYVGTTGGAFSAISLKDGSYVWSIPAGRPVHGEALVTDEYVFFVCDNGFLFKLARGDGKEVWRYDLGDAQSPRVLLHPTIFFWDYRAPKPALADGVLYVGAGDGGFHAVDADSGKRIWRIATKGKIRADAVVAGNKVCFGSFDENLYCVKRSDGGEVWKRSIGEVNSPLTLVDGHVAAGSRGTIIGLYDIDTGEPVWRSFMWGSAAESPMIQYGDIAYAGSSDLRKVSAYDVKSGRVLWRTDIFGVAWGAPVVTEKVIYSTAGGYDPYEIRHLGSLCALDRASGKILWRFVPPTGSNQFETGFAGGATLAGDLLIAGTMDGTLYALPITQ